MKCQINCVSSVIGIGYMHHISPTNNLSYKYSRYLPCKSKFNLFDANTCVFIRSEPAPFWFIQKSALSAIDGSVVDYQTATTSKDSSRRMVTRNMMTCNVNAYATAALVVDGPPSAYFSVCGVRSGSCSKQAFLLPNHRTLASYSLVLGPKFPEEQLMRKHSPRMSSLIKNESWGIEDDQIPS
ncbi:hypothetical protein AAMO2058_001365200 [Amorphochlora amoebiformis]